MESIQQSSIYRHFTRTIPAGAIQTINVYANYITILDNDTSTDVKISINNQSFENLPKGLSIELPEGSNVATDVKFQNNSGGTMMLTFAVSSGKIQDSRLTISGSTFDDILKQSTGSVNVGTYGSFTTSSAVPGTIAIPSNVNRSSFSILNPESNTGTTYIGKDTNLSSTNYMVKLEPGEYFEGNDYLGDVYVLQGVNAEVIMRNENVVA